MIQHQNVTLYEEARLPSAVGLVQHKLDFSHWVGEWWEICCFLLATRVFTSEGFIILRNR